MISKSKIFLGGIEKNLKRMPLIQKISDTRHNIIRYRELSNLLNESKFVILHPYNCSETNTTLPFGIIHEVVKDFIDFYGTIQYGRKKNHQIGVSEGTILLYAPLALLKIPSTHEQYLTQVGAKTRNMIRKAERNGYEFTEFIWNEHLDEIYDINTSKEIRHSEPMHGWYKEVVQPRYHTYEELEYRKYYGGFRDGKLYAYLHVLLCGDFAFFKHFIGHAQHLTAGIMNGLLSWAIREYIGNSQIHWFKYGELSNEVNSMHSFRKHAGFQGYATFLDLKCDQEMFDYSAKKRKTVWRL